MQRFDHVFSYWLFVWYLLFAARFVPYNPLPFLVAGLLFNLGSLLLGYIKDPKPFIFINIFIKILPIYSLMGTPVRAIDYQAGFVYLLMWFAWLIINKEDLFKVRTPLTDFIKEKF